MLNTSILRLLKSGLNPVIFVSIAAHILLVCLTKNAALIFDMLMYWVGMSLIFDSKLNNFGDIDNIVFPRYLVKISTTFIMSLLFLVGIAWGLEEQFLRLCPIIMLAAFAINYVSEKNVIKMVCLMLFSLLFIPTRSSLEMLEILVEPTAQFVTKVISMFGVSLEQNHAILKVSGHLIEISPSCASLGTMRRIVGFGIWLALVKPKSHLGILWIPLLLSLYAFVSNGLRLTALVALKANGLDGWFVFWHGGWGSNALPLLPFVPLLLLLPKSSQSQRQNLT